MNEENLHRARHANRVNARMIAKAPILNGDHRIDHDARNRPIIQPFAVNGANRQDDLPIGPADADHLTQRIAAAQFRKFRQRGIGKAHRAQQPEQQDAARDQPKAHQAAKKATGARRRRR